jgi:hypothetical protein
MWHSTACHNTSGKVRVAGQNRWVPWWFRDDYNGGGEDGPNQSGWVSLEEWEAMPEALQPLMRHHCHALGPDLIQDSVRARAQAAGQRNGWGFDRVGEPGLEHANCTTSVTFPSLVFSGLFGLTLMNEWAAHILVQVAQLEATVATAKL